jgi:hypothetical protein
MADDNIAKPGDTYESMIPYVVPDSLDDLTGPTTGTIELPVSIDWGPDRTYDLGDPDARLWLYTRTIREASSTDQLAQFLNRDLLIELWPKMRLPRRCVEMWHAKFPVLAEAGSGISR